MPASINLAELSADQRKELGIKKPRETAFSKVDLRGWSLKVPALIAGLTRAERERVLKHALRVNKV